jgi:deoxyribodipyrimidine photolyase-related protein
VAAKTTLLMEVRLILGDQLNAEHSWFEEVDDNVCYVMFEMRQETNYVKHHIQKVVAFFGAMRNFARAREKEGHRVLYYTLDDSQNEQVLEKNLNKVISLLGAKRFAYQLPDEFRLDQQLQDFCKGLKISSEAVDTDHFLTTRDEMGQFFAGKKKWVMEFFYRYMRKKFDVLMVHDQPEGGSWNYDKFNRNKWNGSPAIPPPYLPKVEDIEQLQKMIEDQ